MRRGKIAFLGAVAAAVAISSSIWFSEIDRRWEQLDERADALQLQLKTAERAPRPVLYGRTIQGDAWASYDTAISLARADKSLEEAVRPTVYASLKPGERKRLLSAHAGTLDQLRRGAHCTTARNDIEWTWRFSVEAQSLLTTRALANLAVAQAQARIDAGRPVEAVETLLDAAQLGRDLMHSNLMIDEMIGSAVLGISTFWATENSQLLDRLSPEALQRFAEGLAILDESIADVGPSHHSEALLFVRALQGDPDRSEKERWSTKAWRYGFSNRLMLAAMGLHRLDLAERIATSAGEGWPECDRQLSTGCDADPADASSRAALVTRFHTIARLRLLRMAIEHKLGHTVPELPDPFARILQHSIDGEGKARFWSAGPEGQNDLLLFSRNGS